MELQVAFLFLLAVATDVFGSTITKRAKRATPSGLCQTNEVYEVCGTCEGNCENPYPMCSLGCQAAGCQCRNGYVRYGMTCIRPSECPQVANIGGVGAVSGAGGIKPVGVAGGVSGRGIYSEYSGSSRYSGSYGGPERYSERRPGAYGGSVGFGYGRGGVGEYAYGMYGPGERPYVEYRPGYPRRSRPFY